MDNFIYYFKLQYTTTAAASRVPLELGVIFFILISFSLKIFISYSWLTLPYLLINSRIWTVAFLSISISFRLLEFDW